MEQMTERQKRARVAQQFAIQAGAWSLTVVKRLPNFCYVLYDESRQVQARAIILTSSWDYFEYRLYRGKKAFDLVIVQDHNAALPHPVISLETGREYLPGALPEQARPGAKRRNHEEVRLFVSRLLLGLAGANEELQQMPTRTRQRYQQRCRQYLKPRIGRPWAS